MNPSEAKRDIIPVWVSTYEAAKSDDLKSVVNFRSNEIFEEGTKDLLVEFSRAPSLGVAIELLNVSIVEGRGDASTMAAEFITSNGNAPKSIDNIARKILNIEVLRDEDLARSEISKFRAKLRNNSYDPLAWVDLARAYTIAGEKEKSTRAMLTALQISRGHRWVTRSAARMFVHYADFDRAHYCLSSNKNLKSDPWLLATELAVSRMAEKPLKLWTAAKKLVELKVKPIHLSELSSSIGTSELISGANKKAKLFFKKSLIDPTQNSLAQAKWAERKAGLDLGDLIAPSLRSGIRAFEARYWESYNNKDMIAAMSSAKLWFAEEPYSSVPANVVAFIGTILNDFEVVRTITKSALTANPEDDSLKLNYIYAWIATTDFNSVNESEQAKCDMHMRTLRSLMHGENKHNAAHAAANIGMMCYRLNEIALGKGYYDEAEKFFTHVKSPSRLTLILNHVREALIAEAPWAAELLGHAYDVLKVADNIESPAAEFYLSLISDLSNIPGTWREKFSQPVRESGENKSLIIAPRIENISPGFWLPKDFTTKNSIRSLLELWGQPPSKKNK